MIDITTLGTEELELLKEDIQEENGYKILKHTSDHRRGATFYETYIALNNETGQHFVLKYISDDNYGDDSDFEIMEVIVHAKEVTITEYSFEAIPNKVAHV